MPPPRWDLTPIFPSLRSPAFSTERARLVAGVADLARLLDAQVRGTGSRSAPTDGTVAALEEIIRRYEALLETAWTVESYVLALVDTDAEDTAAAGVESELRVPLAEMRHLGRRLAGWLSSIDLDAVLARSLLARERALPLRRLREQAAHAMPDELEGLASAFHPIAGAAWARLRGQVVAGIRVELDIGGRVERVPLSSLRTMAIDPDRAIRQRAYEAEMAAFASQAVPLAAALNGVKGEATLLSARRGWDSPLDEALFTQGLDRAILDAVVSATRAALPDFQRCLVSKGGALSVDRPAWFDLAAPVGEPRTWTFSEAEGLITTAFSKMSPVLGGLAKQAFGDRWIDAEPRAGKQGGGLCYMLSNGRSLVRIEFLGGYDGVRMLAHELGHAHHAAVLARAGRPTLQIETAPAPLMETASKLCEEVVRREALDQARQAGDADGELALLDSFLTGARRSTVDALGNFLFEERLFARRAERDLSAGEINDLLNETRAEMNGNALDPRFPFPWTWAAQPHLYLEGQSFFNLPYLVGQLLAIGLIAQYDADPAGFPARLDDLLANIGRCPTIELGRSFGIDLTSYQFWADGLANVRAEIDRYEAMVDKLHSPRTPYRRPSAP